MFDKVYNNTLEYYNNSQKNHILYEKDEKCLMKNKIIITNKKYNNKYLIIEKNKIKKNKSFCKIVVQILYNLGGRFYSIKSLQNYNIYNFKKINYML